MLCHEARLVEACRLCESKGPNCNCPTAPESSNTITIYTPPSTIFDLVPYKDHTGEQVICVSAHNQSGINIGEVHTIVEQTNEQFGYIRLEKFKEFPNMWFAPECFKKLKAIYDGKEYTLTVAAEIGRRL